MRLLRIIQLCLLVSALLPSVAFAQEATPSLTRIGRGAIENVAWNTEQDYLLVSTAAGAWLYDTTLRDVAHLPDAHMARLSPDGAYIAGVDDSHAIRIWDGTTLEPIEFRDAVMFSRVHTLAWSSDGRYLAVTGNRDQDLTYIWDFQDEKQVVFASRLAGDQLLWSPDGRFLAIFSSTTMAVAVFDTQAWRMPLITPGALYVPYAATARWQGSTHLLIMIYIEGGEATLWNVSTGEQEKTYSFISGFVEYNHRGDTLAVGAYGGLQFHNIDTHEVTGFAFGEDFLNARTFAWSHDDRYLAVGMFYWSRASASEVIIVDPQTGAIQQRLGGAQQAIQQLLWSDDDRYLFAVDARQQMFFYDVTSGETLAYSNAHTIVGATLAWHSDSTQFMLGDSVGGMTLWDVDQTMMLHEFTGALSFITTMLWQPDGDLIAVQARDTPNTMTPGGSITFQMWDVGHRQEVTEEFDFDPVVDFFAWHPQGEAFATLTGVTLQIRDADSRDMTPVVTSRNVLSYMQGLIWSPSGRYMATLMSGYGTGGSWVFDLVSDQVSLATAIVHNGAAVWSPDEHLVSLVWGAIGDPTPSNYVSPILQRLAPPTFVNWGETETTTYTITGLTNNTRQGFLSPNGRYAAAVDDAGSGMIWDATTGAPIAMLADTAHVVWSPDETRMLVQRNDGSLWVLQTNGTIQMQLPISASIQSPVGEFFWSPDGSRIAHLYRGVVDVWDVGEFAVNMFAVPESYTSP